MKVYCGTDIIEVERIKKAMLKSERFKTNVFTENEIEDIEKAENEDVKYQRYAGRFAGVWRQTGHSKHAFLHLSVTIPVFWTDQHSLLLSLARHMKHANPLVFPHQTSMWYFQNPS